MRNDTALHERFNVELFLRIHYEIILPVEDKSISVDSGFSKLVTFIYGLNSYLSLTWNEKMTILLDVADITYAVDSGEFTNVEVNDFFMNSFLNGMNFPN